MTDPFNIFLQNKLDTFRNRLISKMNFKSLFIKEITDGRIPLTRSTSEASILRRPIDKINLTEDELKKEDIRLYNRAVLMTEYKIQEEVERLFSE